MLIQKHIVYCSVSTVFYLRLYSFVSYGFKVERNIIAHIHLSIIVMFMPKGNILGTRLKLIRFHSVVGYH